jgi:hypothetical protein
MDALVREHSERWWAVAGGAFLRTGRRHIISRLCSLSYDFERRRFL